MHYKLHYQINEEVINNITKVMIEMYEEHKDDEFFVKALEDEQ